MKVPGGPEFSIAAGGYRAVIQSVGATLRSLTFGDRDLVVPFSADRVRPLYRGAVVAPWPNRLADGRYEFEGEEHQAPINEVDRQNALHGLALWVRWEQVTVEPAAVTLRHAIPPQPGYPFPVELTVTYRVSADGMVTELRAHNTGDRPAPYGCCPHPYLVAGPGAVDGWSLELSAGTRLEVDPDRLLPVGRAAVSDVDCDFRSGALIGDRFIDHAFTDLAFTGGRTAVRLRAGDGSGVELSWGSWAPWVQIHTADRPEPADNRVGLAVEPMNCPPDAFNSADVPVLAPGAEHLAEWTITALS